MMNPGKIMIGFALVLLSFAMMVSPSGAVGPDDSCDVGSEIILHEGEPGGQTGMHPGPWTAFITNEPQTNATYPYER